MRHRWMPLALLITTGCSSAESLMPMATPGKTIRVGATQPKSRVVDWRLQDPSAVLDRIEAILGELEVLIHKAGDAGCDVIAFPEDTLGLDGWELIHPEAADQVLPRAVSRMLHRLGAAAASHHMYLVCSTDTSDAGAVRNTA